MTRTVTRPPHRQDDPSPGGFRRRGRRVVVFIVVVLFAGFELYTGTDLQTVLLTVLGVGLAGAMVARWVCDDAPLPGVTPLLGQIADHTGGTR